MGTDVTPPAGAWIETQFPFILLDETGVAPPAGAWIETYPLLSSPLHSVGRAPRGRVD